MTSWLRQSQKFDLPFHAKLGTEFLVFLSALMTVLCLLSVTASISLAQLADKWTSGLENTVTIEIPYSPTQEKDAVKILSGLQDAEGIQSARLMDREDMNTLLSPWLGEAASGMKDLPMPALISIDLKERSPGIIRGLTSMVRSLSKDATIDAHEQWLTDLVKFTDTLKIVAVLIMLAIGLVTALTVGGAVRSRMAIHHNELELLHIMGADDRYITGQFQRYIYFLAGKGILLGFIICASAVGILQVMSISGSQALPGLRLTIGQFFALPVAALVLLLISGWTARMTALKVLRAMP